MQVEVDSAYKAIGEEGEARCVRLWNKNPILRHPAVRCFPSMEKVIKMPAGKFIIIIWKSVALGADSAQGMGFNCLFHRPERHAVCT